MSEREFLETLFELRVSVSEVVHQMAKASSDAQERAEQEVADLDKTLPLQALPSGHDTLPSLPYQETMSRFARSRPTLTETEWQGLLRQHTLYLKSGALEWPGLWESLVQSDVTFAIYDGPVASAGTPIDLWMRTLPMDLDAQGADLRLAHMCGFQAPLANLSGANLTRVMGTDSNFAGATLDGANLSRADFSRSNFRGASLRDADLSFADLENCDLTGADLTGATLRATMLPGTCLADATF